MPRYSVEPYRADSVAPFDLMNVPLRQFRSRECLWAGWTVLWSRPTACPPLRSLSLGLALPITCLLHKGTDCEWIF